MSSLAYDERRKTFHLLKINEGEMINSHCCIKLVKKRKEVYDRVNNVDTKHNVSPIFFFSLSFFLFLLFAFWTSTPASFVLLCKCFERTYTYRKKDRNIDNSIHVLSYTSLLIYMRRITLSLYLLFVVLSIEFVF